MPLPLTVSSFSKILIGFTFLVPAHPGSPGKRAVKRTRTVHACVRVCSVQFSSCAVNEPLETDKPFEAAVGFRCRKCGRIDPVRKLQRSAQLCDKQLIWCCLLLLYTAVPPYLSQQTEQAHSKSVKKVAHTRLPSVGIWQIWQEYLTRDMTHNSNKENM